MIKYIICGIIIILLSILLFYIIKLYKQRNKYKEEYIKKRKKEIEIAVSEERRSLEEVQQRRRTAEKSFDDWKEQEEKHLHEREKVVKKCIEALEQQKEAREQSEKELEEHYKTALDDKLQTYYGSNLAEYTRTLRAVENDLHEALEEEFYNECASLNSDIDELRSTLNEYQEKRNAINAEILRQRALDEQQDFYRICITDDDLSDIDILLTLKARLHKTSYLDKIIYDTYVSKYVKEMSKRVLAGKDPSGIYKVTNIKTNEIYIGKSTTVATRWSNHCKSAFGLEGVADSQFQRALKKYGVQSFTWELLEEVPKEKLTDREKFYIVFYDTTTYGYNQKIG